MKTQIKGINNRLNEMSDEELLKRFEVVNNTYYVIMSYYQNKNIEGLIKLLETVSTDMIKSQVKGDTLELYDIMFEDVFDSYNKFVRAIITLKNMASEYIITCTENASDVLSYKSNILSEIEQRGIEAPSDFVSI